MRKNELHAMVSTLKSRNAELTRERDEARDVVHESLSKLHGKMNRLTDEVAGVAGKAESHAAALVKHGDDLSGLAEAVRASLLGHAKDEPEAVTPITSKRNGKAAV